MLSADGMVELDSARNFALKGLTIGGQTYASGGSFPEFTCIDVTGKILRVPCTDERWNVRRDDAGITYACQGLEVSIDYRRTDQDTLRITTRVRREGLWRLLSVGDGGGLLAIPPTQSEEVSFVTCADGGRICRQPTWWRDVRFGSPLQANFVAVLQNGQGLILHPTHHAYSIGFGPRDNQYRMGCEQFFRPTKTAWFAMPLCHEALSLELVPLSDSNADGTVNWVDAGILYRDRYIKPNRDLDPALRDGPSGKLRWKPVPELRATLQRLREEIPDRPISIWMLAPVGPSTDFLPSETLREEWRDLKSDMARIGIRLSPHDNLDDIAPEIAAADPSHIRRNENLGLMPAYRDCFRRSLSDDAHLAAAIKARLGAWSVHRGDTYHIDVFAHSPIEDYCPTLPSTFETDFRRRYDWLAYIHDKRRVHVTSEFLVEGCHEVCDYSWWSLFWNDCAADETRIPLLPVLFLGKTYCGTFNPTAKTWVNHDVPRGHPNVGESLLWGVKVHTDLPDEFAPLYEDQNRYWAEIADKTVDNITLNDGWWSVRYTDGSTLRVLENGGRWEDMQAGHFVFQPTAETDDKR